MTNTDNWTRYDDSCPVEVGLYFVTIQFDSTRVVAVLNWDGNKFNTIYDVIAWRPIDIPRPYSN